MSRRSFVTGAAAAATAAWTAHRAAAAPGGDTPPLRVGLVGCGGRGTGAAENCLRSAPNVRLVALADIFPEPLERCRKSLIDPDRDGGALSGVMLDDARCFTGFDAYRRLIDCGVDLVLLATPPGFRPLHFEAAVEAGKHVFMEKPVAVDPVGVRRVIAAGEKAKAKGLGVVAGTLYRHQKSFIETIRRIHDGAIGDVVAAFCYYNTGATGNLYRNGERAGLSDMEHQIRNWYFYDWLSGDHIVEQHVHTLDVVDWVLRAHPIQAVGVGGRQVRVEPVYGNIYDHFGIDYEFPNRVHVMSQCRQIAGAAGYRGVHVIGARGTAETHTGVIRGATPWTYEGEFKEKPSSEQAYVQEHTDLIESIRGGKPLNEARQIAESTLTAILGREAAYTGKIVTWDEMAASPLDLGPRAYEFGPHPVRPVPMPGRTQ